MATPARHMQRWARRADRRSGQRATRAALSSRGTAALVLTKRRKGQSDVWQRRGSAKRAADSGRRRTLKEGRELCVQCSGRAEGWTADVLLSHRVQLSVGQVNDCFITEVH